MPYLITQLWEHIIINIFKIKFPLFKIYNKYISKKYVPYYICAVILKNFYLFKQREIINILTVQRLKVINFNLI